MNYTELHLHDHFSALDGLNTPAEYMVRAKELGMTHLAQTNHGTLSGHRQFQIAAKEAGIIPILGVEAYISPTDRFDVRSRASRQDGTSIYNHIILLAKNANGLKTLNRLNEEAWKTGFYFKPRIDEELLFSDNDDLIVTSACLGGLICKAIEAGDVFHAGQIAARFKEALGDRFYIEVQGHNPVEMNQQLLKIADENGIKAVATSDCHYARKEDLWIEQAMLILSSSPKMNYHADFNKAQKMDILDRFNYLYPDRTMTFEKIEIYLRDRQSNFDLFTKQGIDRQDIYDNTVEIGNRIGEYPFHQGLELLPKPTTGDPDALLAKKAWAGLKKRGLDKKPEYRARLEEELAIIKEKKFSTYFLIIANTLTWARNQKIRVGPGRGSGAGSLVNYACYITDVDPIEYGLLFFRFINPERNDFPDIDIDFGDRRRGEVKEYVRRTFKNAASIATYTMFDGKVAIRDAARVLNIPKIDVNKAMKNNNAPPNVDYFPVFEASDKGREFNNKYPEVLPLAKALTGRIRNGGMHASGLVVANQNIFNIAPMETAKDPNDKNGPRIPMVAQDMEECADIGLIKLDFLGLKAMTIIDDTLRYVKERHGNDIVLEQIDLEDKKVYEMLSAGYTKGVFQCEAVPYTNLILKMGGVYSFAELAATNALVRPGAANTIGAEYISRKNGALVTYVHPLMKPFTEETYGEVLYQEQVMLTMTELAGMKMSTADKVRKIIGKKKDVSEFEQFKEEFLEGASKNISRKKAEKLWTDFEAHAGYSFNKSHAVAYSMVSFWTAWLKCYYPLEFMAATLYAETLNKGADSKHSITDYLIEAKRLGIKVLIPHVNKSDKGITISDEGIRLGLTNIKFIADKGAENLIKHRPYRDYAHLLEVSETKGSGVTSRLVGAMNAVGSAIFPDNPKRGNERDNFYEYLNIPAFGDLDIEPVVKVKFRELDEYDEKGAFPILAMARGIKTGPGWARVEVVDETGSAGIFADQHTQIETGQMYAILVGDNRIFTYMTMDELRAKEGNVGFVEYLYDPTNGSEIPEGSYKVIATKRHKTKANKKMLYTVLQDDLGELYQAMVFPAQYDKMYMKLRDGRSVNAVLAETDNGSFYIKEIK